MTNAEKFTQLLPRYQSAFLACNGREIRVTYKRGWVTTGEIFKAKYRIGKFEEMTRTLEARAEDKAIRERL